MFERQGNSNRKAKHASPKKLEIPFAVQLKMCEEMKEDRKSFPDAQSFFREMKKKYKGLKRERLEHILASEEKLRTAVHNEKQRRRQVGKPRGQKYMRLEGAGRKKQFPEVISELAAWINEMRSYGHTVLKRHVLWRYYELLDERVLTLEAQMQSNQTETASIQKQVDFIKSHKEKLVKSEKYQESRTKALIAWCGAKHCKPHLLTKLSPLEEKVRAQLTWQSFDEQLYLAAFGDEEPLKQFGSKP